MESRLRKFLSPRRIKTPVENPNNTEFDLRTTTPSTESAVAQPQRRLPDLINSALRRPSTAKRKDGGTREVRSLSYDSTVAGPLPELGDKPQRGNGPVKLQTSRRLSSGELLVTQQDYDRTLEDIRQGDFILGGKEKRSSRQHVERGPTSDPSRIKFISTAPNSPGIQSTFPNPIWIPPFTTSNGQSSPRIAIQAYGTDPDSSGPYSSAETNLPPFGSGGLVPDARTFRPISPGSSPRPMTSTASLYSKQEEQNPTLQALWKAEYSQLMSIYSHRAEATNRDAPLRSPGRPTFREDERLQGERRVLSDLSNTSTTYSVVDESDSSSNVRHSTLSSSGASSSYMTHTGAPEDYSTPREDIRRIVEDMRMNYLNAIEAQTPPLKPLPDIPTQKPRSKKPPRSLTSRTSVESGLHSINRQSGSSRIKSWQSASSSHAVNTPRTSISSPPGKQSSKRQSLGNSRRTSAQAAAGISTLPAIEASPRKTRRSGEDIGLKRADSTTLGSMEKSLVILTNRGSNASSQPTIASTPTLIHSSDSDNGSTMDECPPSPKFEPSSILGVEKNGISDVPSLPATTSSWHIEAERLFADADHEADISVDIDDFEALCNDLFRSSEPVRLPCGEVARGEADLVSASDVPDNISPNSPNLKGLGLLGMAALS